MRILLITFDDLIVCLKEIGVFTILLFVFGLLPAQKEDDFFYGKLIDAKTGEPVVFATVRLKTKALGVISNNDGSFQVPTEFQFKGDELEISSMGYQTMNIAFSDLEEDIVNLIYVKRAIFELAETFVAGRKKRKPTAKQIIRYALDRIPDNYQNDSFGLIGYYRDYQFKDKKYINLNEALVKVIDKGFIEDDYRNIQFGLFDYETNLDFKIDSFAAKPYDYSNRDKFIPSATFGETYAPNELVLLFIHDAIRNHDIDAYSYVYTMVEDFIKEHRFSKVENTSYGDQKVYQIDFRKTELPFQVKGTIYIDHSTFAIRKLDYAVYKQKQDDSSPSRFSTTKKELLYEILVEYQWFKDRMYLNYISFHNQFKLIRPPRFFIKDIALEFPPKNLRSLIKKRMKVMLNAPASNWPTDVLVRYQGEPLKIEDSFQQDSTSFTLEFAEKTQKQKALVNLLFSTEKDTMKRSLEIKVPQLIDEGGNRLGERESEIIDQFREFFTQRIIYDTTQVVPDSLLVKKKFSLGVREQPRLKQQFDEDFWMNTPLKVVDN
ncbi:MAG: carboxypeptidase-like regulatory domain-containing protein [Bacteroidota bacterium]